MTAGFCDSIATGREMPRILLNKSPKSGSIQVQPQLDGLSVTAISAAWSAIAASLLALAACGGSGNNPALTLSGTVSGLTTSGLALANNGVNLEISSGATSFT